MSIIFWDIFIKVSGFHFPFFANTIYYSTVKSLIFIDTSTIHTPLYYGKIKVI